MKLSISNGPVSTRMSNRKRVLTSVILGAVFLLLFFLLLFTYSFPQSVPSFLLVLLTYHFEFMTGMVVLGVIFGAAIYYLMQEQVQELEVESKVNAELALSLLNPDERKTVKLLLEKKGECLQAEVARVEGMNRLKAHRVAKTLIERGVILSEKRGKVVILRLAENVIQALSA